MKTEVISINVLIPANNKFLYNKKEKIISDKVYLGSEASADDWQEITADEKEALEKEWEKEISDVTSPVVAE